MRVKRRYTDAQRAEAILATQANKGDTAKTAKQLGIPERTLRHWFTEDYHPVTAKEVARIAEEKREPMAEALDRLAWKLLDNLEETYQAAPFHHKATAFGISFDKARILRDQPTDITKTETNRTFTVNYQVTACAGSEHPGLPEASRLPAIDGPV